MRPPRRDRDGTGGDGNCANYDGLIASGICLPVTPTRATVGQGEAGLGFDLFPLTSMIGIFLEAGVHGYDSPAHTFRAGDAGA